MKHALISSLSVLLLSARLAAAGTQPVWSEIGKDGLQVGIAVTNTAVKALGDIKADITFRNAGKQPLAINTWDLAAGYFGLSVLDAAGKPVPKLPPPMPAPPPGTEAGKKWQANRAKGNVEIAPGNQVSYAFSAPISLSQPSGKYFVVFTHAGLTTPRVAVTLTAPAGE